MQKTNYDSDFCGGLPIHLTNLIQPYGLLLVIDKTSFEIVQSSENTADVFSQSVQQIVNTNLADHIHATNFSLLKEKLANQFNDKIPAVWEIGGKKFLVLIQRKEKYLLVEIDVDAIDLLGQESFVDVYQELKYAMSAIESTTTIEETCRLAANELKRISGFDKVMVYRFDEDWNGFVMAEDREPDMESYMNFTFPASDIPKQARDLYLKNPYRLIPDKDYKPVKLFPVINPVTNSFIDLSDCNVRSVASVHIEYLKNMGVTASMSTRILHNGKLWGLIACHHKTPKYLGYEKCSVFEMMSSIISVKITSLQNDTAHHVQRRVSTTYAELIDVVYKTGNIESMLTDELILKLFDCSGALISKGNKVIAVGVVPSKDDIEETILWLHTRQFRKVYSTESFGNEYEYAKLFSDVGSGIMAVPINATLDQYLILFRPEKVRVITWGGNPDERIQFEKDERNYHPRNSFKQWQQKVSGISLPWKAEEIITAETLRSFIYEYQTSVISGK